ncbi:RNA polymerase sigma factor [Spirosoma pollinicola]|uniref:RNA polymerase subunit sigma-24 n=1 Tax=Spirosoma pollinicola TaxID=2057025 RepID=A0A2K8Z348_9BACT|nr:RNA polymerase sigma factor [Spirosoma pollinicola]AUD04293.1 RNA polymerase subunit sigma-24 [Spirosoma pollinicola]
MIHLSDQELVTRYLNQSDDRYLAQLYIRHRQKVYQKCYFYTGNSDDSEDFVQDIFIRLTQKLTSYKGDAKFTSWLHVVTVNYCLDQLRKKQQEQALWRNYLHDTSITNDWSDTSEESCFQASEKVFGQLTPIQRTLLLTKYGERSTIKEIAISQSLTFSAVKMRIKRARDHARTLYFKVMAEQEYWESPS